MRYKVKKWKKGMKYFTIYDILNTEYGVNSIEKSESK